MDAIEKAFETTSGVIFGKPLRGITQYGRWLEMHVRKSITEKSALSEKTTSVVDMLYTKEISKRMANEEEAFELGKQDIGMGAAETLQLSNAGEKLMKIKIVTSNSEVGKNVNMVDCTLYGHSSHCFKASAVMKSKYCAYSFWPRECESVFGSSYIFSSGFCINCYNSVNLTRCFEISDCNNCSDCYFCHNCENLSNCMFCFNAKSLRYAIGNKEVGRENYMKIKKIVLDEITKNLEKDKDLELSIYNAGCCKKFKNCR